MAVEYVAQWYWCRDYLNRKCKAYYIGPRENWMYVLKEESDNTAKNTTTNGTTNSVS